MKVGNFVFGVGLFSMSLSCAMADTLYAYEGQKYNSGSVVAPYTANMNLRGSVTLAAPLPSGLVSAPIGPGTPYPISSWWFNDGVNTYRPNNSQIGADAASRYPRRFAVSTDGSGNIVAWELFMISPKSPNVVGQHVNTFLVDSTNGDLVGDKSGTTCSYLEGDVCKQVLGTYTSSSKGTWTMKTIAPSRPTPVPTLEWPGLMALMGGVLGFVAWQRRRSLM